MSNGSSVTFNLQFEIPASQLERGELLTPPEEVIGEIIVNMVNEIDLRIISDINTVSTTRKRELPYISQETMDDIRAWAPMTLGYGMILQEMQMDKAETHNWKQEGF